MCSISIWMLSGDTLFYTHPYHDYYDVDQTHNVRSASQIDTLSSQEVERTISRSLQSLQNCKTDLVWTKDLSTQVINDLKLNLSWDLGLRVFNMSRGTIRTRII